MAEAEACGDTGAELASFLTLKSNNLATYEYQSNPNNLYTIEYS